MRKTIDSGVQPKQPTRRQFVQGALTAGFLTSVGAWAPLRRASAAGFRTMPMFPARGQHDNAPQGTGRFMTERMTGARRRRNRSDKQREHRPKLRP